MGLTFSSLLSRLFSKREMRILMVGLDAAGKTTILNQLKLGEVLATTPTLGFNVETVEYKNICFNVWDIGGQSNIRKLWNRYTENANAVIFVIDSTDVQRIDEAGKELHNILSEKSLENAPLLILANKQDLPNPMNTALLNEKLGLSEMRTRKCYIQSTCATEGKGIYEGLDWLSNELSRTS